MKIHTFPWELSIAHTSSGLGFVEQFLSTLGRLPQECFKACLGFLVTFRHLPARGLMLESGYWLRCRGTDAAATGEGTWRRTGGVWDLQVASICFFTTENCWAKSSTVSPNRPAWEMMALRKCTFSASLILARLSNRCCSWTARVDITRPSACAMTFIAHRARSAAKSAPDLVVLVQDYPCACLSMPWSDAPAGWPLHAGWRQSVQKRCKILPLGFGLESRMVPSRWLHFMGTGAP